MVMMAIKVSNLSFRYPDSKNYVIKGLSCDIKGSKSIGLLGTNGSGKTTFIKLISGLLKPTSGEIALYYGDIKKTIDKKSYIGFVPENAKLLLLGPTFREDFGRVVQDRRIADNIIEELNIDHLADKKLYHLSEGQRRLLAYILVFHLPNKKLLLIDEPTIGLDQKGRNLFIKMVDKAIDQDQMVIISTNDPRILPKLQYLVVLKDRRIGLEGSTKEVLYRLEQETSLIPNQIVRLMRLLGREANNKHSQISTVDELNELIRSRV